MEEEGIGIEKPDCEKAKKRLLSFQSSVSISDAEVVAELLSYLNLYPSLADLIGDVIATLAREESFRDEAAKFMLPKYLVSHLSIEDLHTRLQVLRATGNLCIDHDLNREGFLDANICEIVTGLIDGCCDSSKEESSNERYKLVICGCILNLIADNDKLTDCFVRRGALERLSILLHLEQSAAVKEMGLKALGVLCESDELSTPGTSKLTDLLVKLSSMDELVIDIIETLVKKGDEKILLQVVDSGLVQNLLDNDGDYYQKSVDIVVLMLGNDSCMEKLYVIGDMLSQAKEWLQSSAQKHMVNAALIVANFARSDSKCAALVANGYVQLLLPLTKIEETKEYEGKLHFSTLSALRNLSISGDLKSDLVSLGVVDGAIHCLQTSSFLHVQFKALGVLRLLVQKQSNACSKVVEAIQRIVSVTESTTTSHVCIEAGRLLSGIIKYSQDKTVLMKVVKDGGLQLVYGLVQSTDPVLIGEGLLAINIIASIPDDQMFFTMIETMKETFIDCVCSKFTLKSLDVLNNSLVLVTTLCSKESELRTKLLSSKLLKEAVKELVSHENESILSKAEETLALLCV